MVSVGLHALVLRKHKGCELTEQPAAWEDQIKQIDPETAKYFAEIANAIEGTEIELEEPDRSGSHVVETALKSVSIHLQDNENHYNENHSLIEKALKKICKAIVVNPVDIMCSCHGSHVLRSLLCLFNGVPLEEFHSTKSSAGLAERLNLKAPHAKDNGSMQSLKIFPSLLKKFISEMLNAASEDILKLQVNQYSSLVLQAILEFSPESLYNELLTKVFRKSLFLMSSHHCANFVVQALASHAKSQDHMDLIWEELGTKFHNLFEMGRSGVVASILAATQRLHNHEHQCCQAIAAAVCAGDDFPKLRGHFGELSVHPFGSFTAEKCFTASNLNLRETIVSEMLPLQAELSKTKQGPYLLRKLDIDGFARQPDQWKSRQASQQSALKEFYATFGPAETKSFEKDSFLADSVSKSKPGKLKDIRKEIETSLPSAKTSNTPFLAHQWKLTLYYQATLILNERIDLEALFFAEVVLLVVILWRREPDYVLEGSEGTPFAGGYYYGKIKFPPEYPFKPPGISMTTPNRRFMTQKKICLYMSDFHPESWNPMWSVSSIRATSEWYGGKGGSSDGGIGLYFPPCGSKSAYQEKRTKLPCSTTSMIISSASYMICALKLSNIFIYPHCPKYAQRDCSPNFSMLLVYLLTLPSDDSFTQITGHDPMDNSPTTGSASTTVAEKEKLAKASLAFNCKNSRSPARETDMLFYCVFFCVITFLLGRRVIYSLFCFYVEKYEQQQSSNRSLFQSRHNPCQLEQKRLDPCWKSMEIPQRMK
ncbi:Pumilio -like protein 23 [Capsicum baccatum]|uniref:Pumilio-like protein 23 n=1 Tax=Capsicum baccatum TaxID=33114 RepID=A0A2G2WL07_CAPBA|nr:Pumilio -like protein 23 [Capsicum baccatum]